MWSVIRIADGAVDNGKALSGCGELKVLGQRWDWWVYDKVQCLCYADVEIDLEYRIRRRRVEYGSDSFNNATGIAHVCARIDLHSENDQGQLHRTLQF